MPGFFDVLRIGFDVRGKQQDFRSKTDDVLPIWWQEDCISSLER